MLHRSPNQVRLSQRPAAGDRSTSSFGGLASSSTGKLHDAGTVQLEVLQQLAREIQQLEGGARSRATLQVTSAGCTELDALLPHGGYAPGSVVEYLRTAPACGACTLVWAAASAAMQTTKGFLVVVDTLQHIYPPALASQGIDLAKVVFVRPQSHADALWAVDQALRTQAVAAVVSELELFDDRAARRLQLAAEHGQGRALVLRSSAALRKPSWAEIQWLVKPELSQATTGRRKIQVQLARARGGQAGSRLWLQIDPLTGKLQQASPQVVPSEKHGDETSSTTLQPSHKIAARVAAPAQVAVAVAVAAESTLHLASQLAHTAHRSRRAEAG